jgi:hypothetical protein
MVGSIYFCGGMRNGISTQPHITTHRTTSASRRPQTSNKLNRKSLYPARRKMITPQLVVLARSWDFLLIILNELAHCRTARPAPEGNLFYVGRVPGCQAEANI